MTNRTSVSEADLSALAAYCDGALEGANPPLPTGSILRLAAHAFPEDAPGAWVRPAAMLEPEIAGER